MGDLKLELKQLIIATLDLEDIEVTDIQDDEALFIDGLGLDSIDALELGLAIKKTYNVKIDANSEETKQHFSSINALAEFVKHAKA
jgi:acyl carrier protein